MTLNFSLRRDVVATRTHAESQGHLGPSGGQVSRQRGGRWFGPIGPPSTEHAHVDCWVGSRVNGTAAVLPVGRRGTTFDAGTAAPPPLPARLFFPTTPPPTQEAPAAAAAVANSGRKQNPSARNSRVRRRGWMMPLSSCVRRSVGARSDVGRRIKPVDRSSCQ